MVMASERVGAAILTAGLEGAWVAMACCSHAGNLVLTGRFFDVAVRDVEMAIAAFALARPTEVHDVARIRVVESGAVV